MSEPGVTSFDETAALWAVMNADPDQAEAVVKAMLPGERAEFEAHLSILMALVWSTV
jgi:hypothetical protein